MEKILISACLLGDKTKYDGGDNYWPFVEELKKKYELIPFCPEVEGGLSIPRSPCEIQNDGSVKNKEGKDCSKEYALGAEKAFMACRLFGVRIAILKEGSPSCGSRNVYDGSFKGNKVAGLGITARRLIAAGIKVYSNEDNLSFLLGESDEIKEKRKQKNIQKEKDKKLDKEPSFKKKESFSKKPFKRDFNKDSKEGFDFKKKRDFKGRKPSFRKDDKERKGSFSKKPYSKNSFSKEERIDNCFYKDYQNHKSYRKDDSTKEYSKDHKSSFKKKTFHKDDHSYKGNSFKKNGFKKNTRSFKGKINSFKKDYNH